MKEQPKRPSGAARAERLKKTRSMRLKLTLFAFAVITLSCLITVAIYYVILKVFGKTPIVITLTVNPIFAAVVLLAACSLIATILFGWLSKYYLRPIKKLIHATREIGKGNFAIRVGSNEKHPVSEMQQLLENFDRMTEELGGIELFRNDFINHFSHEFKTPIVSIRGFAKELQRTDLLPEERMEYARIIEEESTRLAKLSSGILELSKLEHQTILADRSVFDLDEQIRRCILALESEWTAGEIEILPELVEVAYESSEELLSLVWRNLISNAVKFTPAGGSVTVKMAVWSDHISVTVEDTGIGMTEAVMEHIFEKFYQGDPSHSKQGYGVGLATVRRALDLCGGKIEVRSQVGNGSAFTVTLPIET